jgi:glycosyltransferase involved in cell wall biosynthesis
LSKIRILFLSWRDIHNPVAGGAENYLQTICSRLVRNGYDVTVFTSAFSGGKPEEVVDGVKIIRRGSKIGMYLLASIFFLLHWRSKFDCVIENKDGGLPWLTRFYAGRRVIALVHQTGSDFSKNSYQNSTWYHEVKGVAGYLLYLAEPLMLSVYRFYTVIAVSNSTKNSLLTLGLNPNAITVVQPGIERKPLVSVPEKTNKPTIIYLGRIKRSKGLSDVITALAQVKAKLGEVNLWIIGRGDASYISEIETSIKNLNLSANVTFFGFASDQTKTELLSKAHVLVVPSVREGWGLVVTEANCVGTPSIGYDVAGLRDSILDGQTGLLVRAANASALADGLIKVLSHDALRETLSENALQYSANFCWDRATGRFMKVIAQVCTR